MSDATITPRPGDTSNNLLAKILRRLDGIASPGDTNAQLLAKILAQFAGGGGGGGSGSFIGLTDVPASFAGAAGKEVFVNAGATALEFVGPYFTKVGTAYLGGDQTGNARGAGALDIQSDRAAATQIAKNVQSVAIGSQNTASGDYAVAIGTLCTASQYNAFALGFNCIASGARATAVGSVVTASGDYSSAFGCESVSSGPNAISVGFNAGASGEGTSAIGSNSKARVDFTSNFGAPIINRKDNGESSGTAFQTFCGTEVILVSKEVDLKSVADQTLTLPAGCHFFPNEVGVWVTSINTMTVQPTVRFGRTGTPAGLVAAAITTALTATFKRERYTTLLDAAGQTSLVAGVTVGASATTLLGRFYWKGLLVEDE